MNEITLQDPSEETSELRENTESELQNHNYKICLAKTKFYIHNLLITNENLLKNNNINSLILF